MMRMIRGISMTHNVGTSNLAGFSTLVCNPRTVSPSFLPRSTFPHTRHFHGFHFARPRKTIFHDRRWSLSAYASSSSLELPLLPFDVNDVLVPSESKTLHLYEARYLALLEESLFRKNKLFVHFVLDPIAVSDTSGELSFAARHGCLVLIENVERLDVGALVTIRGIGRVKIIEFLQADPYLRGTILPVRDNIVEDATGSSTKVMELKDALHNLNSLEIKLKAPKEALLQTHILNSLTWAEKGIFVDMDEKFVPSLAERVSFTAFQPISGSTKSELQSLQLKKLMAVDIKNTIERLNESLELTKANISTMAAKLAIQSVEIR
ncbi:uncharacterized protein LOC111022391 isoform X1 [Momordica charantia]|uniref:Uncharacterized protein LOC111022391 isoform X1 n=1 Tax=Momordica charantia TaxID=3673 RepID=A0A6J1DR59_MOMCH|nr:uncharacterized protein LOC111022391 isoform X1 [Momordica charantia]